MLNLIQSFLITFITIIFKAVVAFRGPLAVGGVVAVLLLSFSANAEAASTDTVHGTVTFTYYQVVGIIGCLITAFLALFFYMENKSK